MHAHMWKDFEQPLGTVPCTRVGLGGRPPSLGAFDVLDAYVVYRLVGGDHPPAALAAAIADLQPLVAEYADVNRFCDRWRLEVGAGLLLWRASFFPDEPWARSVRDGALKQLDAMWSPLKSVFFRSSAKCDVLPYGNFIAAIGLQAAHVWPFRVAALNNFFEDYKAGDEMDAKPITWVTGCAALFPGELLRDNWKPALDRKTGAVKLAEPTPVPAPASAAKGKSKQEAVPAGELEAASASAVASAGG